MMNRFELFTMIFYALDLYYDEHPSDDLGGFLGAMSPFTFKEVDSADSAVYDGFCKAVEQAYINVEESYDLASAYLKTIENVDVYTPFLSVSREDWIHGCKDYLSKPHKGQDIEESSGDD